MVLRVSAPILVKHHGAFCKGTPAKAILACSCEQYDSTFHDGVALTKPVQNQHLLPAMNVWEV